MQNKAAIIGAGPAGIACAIQLSRYGIMPLRFEKDMPGGLLKNAKLVENYTGFTGGVKGTVLVRKMSKHLESSGIPLIHEEVTHITFRDDIFYILTNENQYSSQILVIASGTSPIEHQALSIKHRIFYEVYPIRDIQDARIAIIGAGDAAFDYALQLAIYNKVYIFNRSGRVKCLPVLWHRAKGIEQINYHENHSLIKTEFDPALNCLKLFFETREKTTYHLADYIIFAIGRKPELSYADPLLIKRLDELQQARKLYMIGDVKNELFRQASIAVGDGIRAAMQIYFNESNKKDLR